MSFLEESFPIGIAKGSEGRQIFSNDRTVTGSGSNYVNINWPSPDFEINVATGIRSVDDLDELQEFHAAVKAAHGFRFQFFRNWKSCSPQATIAADDQTIVSDATAGQTTAQLVKTYTKGSMSTQLLIYKPISSTTILEKNGDPFTTGWSLDTTTGIITFSPGLTEHDAITAGYHFELPVMFESDDLPYKIDSYFSGEITVKLVTYR